MSKPHKNKSRKSKKKKTRSVKNGHRVTVELLPEGTRTLPELNIIPMMKEAISLVKLSKKEIDLSPCTSGTLLKSSIVLITACWEAFLEDAVTQAFDFLLCNISNPGDLPKQLKKVIANSIKKDKNELKVWDLAGEGWRDVLEDHKSTMIHKSIRSFNAPNSMNIDDLFFNIIGFPNISSTWQEYEDHSPSDIRNKLNKYIDIRHLIAHGSCEVPKLTHELVDEYIYLVVTTCISIADESRKFVERITNKEFAEKYKDTKVLMPRGDEEGFNLPLVFRVK